MGPLTTRGRGGDLVIVPSALSIEVGPQRAIIHTFGSLRGTCTYLPSWAGLQVHFSAT